MKLILSESFSTGPTTTWVRLFDAWEDLGGFALYVSSEDQVPLFMSLREGVAAWLDKCLEVEK